MKYRPLPAKDRPPSLVFLQIMGKAREETSSGKKAHRHKHSHKHSKHKKHHHHRKHKKSKSKVSAHQMKFDDQALQSALASLDAITFQAEADSELLKHLEGQVAESDDSDGSVSSVDGAVVDPAPPSQPSPDSQPSHIEPSDILPDSSSNVAQSDSENMELKDRVMKSEQKHTTAKSTIEVKPFGKRPSARTITINIQKKSFEDVKEAYEEQSSAAGVSGHVVSGETVSVQSGDSKVTYVNLKKSEVDSTFPTAKDVSHSNDISGDTKKKSSHRSYRKKARSSSRSVSPPAKQTRSRYTRSPLSSTSRSPQRQNKSGAHSHSGSGYRIATPRKHTHRSGGRSHSRSRRSHSRSRRSHSRSRRSPSRSRRSHSRSRRSRSRSRRSHSRTRSHSQSRRRRRRERLYSRSGERSYSRAGRSRSRSHGRHHSKSRHGRSRHQRSCSPRRRYRDRYSRSRSRSSRRRRKRSYSRSRSRSHSRSLSRLHPSSSQDKGNDAVPDSGEQVGSKIGVITQFTNLCKELQDKQAREDVLTPEERAELEAKALEEETEYRAPFELKPSNYQPGLVLHNSAWKTSNQIVAESNALAVCRPLEEKFPVSAGFEHKQHDEVGDTSSASEPSNIFARNYQPVSVSDLVIKRVEASQKLQLNPADSEAKDTLQYIEQQTKVWAESKMKPGQFTGDQKITALTRDDHKVGIQAWAKKKMFHGLAPVMSGFGLKMLRKMGWEIGQPLGRTGEGHTEPIAVDVKVDRSGLTTVADKKQGVVPASALQSSDAKAASLVQGKHPVSVLQEICAKKRWNTPHYELLDSSGPAHKKGFLYRVTTPLGSFQPAVASNSKKLAKSQAAHAALQGLGLVDTTISYSAS